MNCIIKINTMTYSLERFLACHYILIDDNKVIDQMTVVIDQYNLSQNITLLAYETSS